MRFNWGLMLVFAVATVMALAGANSLIGALAMLVLAFGLFLLWRPDVPAVFVFIFAYQWLQASTKVFEANLAGAPVDDLSQFGGDVETAIVLTLASLATLGVGIRWGLGKAPRSQLEGAALEVDDKVPIYWFWVFVGAFFVSFVAQSLAYVRPELSQPLLALAGLKWAFYWILAHVAITRGGVVRSLWLLFFVFELGFGIVGYFSDFKTVLFFTMLAVLSSGVRMTATRIVMLIILLTVAVTFAVAWTAIKTEQRKFLSQDERAQVVAVTATESWNNILELAGKLDGEQMLKASGMLASRISYVDFFSKTIEFVPEDTPFEYGAIWGDAIIRPLMPRALFPEKGVIDDSERTSQYTGMRIMGQEEGVSISLGYVAEAYIDFGPLAMALPVLALGWCFGRYYRWMANYAYSRGIIGSALATATLFQAAYLETSITKMVGGLAVSALVGWLIARFIVPMLATRRAKPRPRAMP
jgi:hypothetical protein